jgi:hypothetical protein
MQGENNGNYHSLSLKVTRRLAAGLTYLASYTLVESAGQRQCDSRHFGRHPPARQPLPEVRLRLFRLQRAKTLCNVSALRIALRQRQMFCERGRPAQSDYRRMAARLDRNLAIRARHQYAGKRRYARNWRPWGNSPELDGHFAQFAGRTTLHRQMVQCRSLHSAGSRNVRQCHAERASGALAFTWDASALKQFPIRERQNLEFRFEMFNAANHPNWGTPNTSWSSTNPRTPGAAFLSITGTNNTMRQMQFALKYVF